MGPLHQVEDRTGEAAVLFQRTTHPSVPYTRDGRLQTATVSKTTQEPRPKHTRRLPPQHLVQPAKPRVAWTLQRTVQTASSRHRTSKCSGVIGRSPRATNFCSGSRASYATWQHSAPSWLTFDPAPEPAAQAPGSFPEMMLQTSSAGTIADKEPDHKSVGSPQPMASRKTNRAGIDGGTCLHPNQRLFFLFLVGWD
jgi:hypothetical protein